MGRTMRSRGVSSYKSNKRGKRSSNKLSKRLSKRRVKGTNKRINRRLNRKSFKRVSKRMRKFNKSNRRQNNMFLGGDPNDPPYVLRCTKWRSAGTEEKKYIEYCITVNGPDIKEYEIWRRWSECKKLDVGCYNLGNWTKDSKPRPAYSLNFPSSGWFVGFDETKLNVRKSQLDAYFESFAQWINQVLINSDYTMDLMKGHYLADRKKVIKSFFDQKRDAGAGGDMSPFHDAPDDETGDDEIERGP